MLSRLLVIGWMVAGSTCFGWAQSPYFHYFQDTLRPGYRLSGNFDSIDVVIASTQSTLPTAWRPALLATTPEAWYRGSSLPTQPLRYSSIPHVGLFYSFGTNNSQNAGISYTQALSPQQYIQMDYRRAASAGAIRNAALENNQFFLAHLTRTKRYASQFLLRFDGTNKGLNGGLTGDTVETDQPILFNGVNKTNAGQRERQFAIDWWNFLSFTKDSLIKTGVYIKPQFIIRNRRFQENDSIDKIYGVVNIDTSETKDFWERSELGAAGGYFFHSRLLAVNGGVFMRYWDFDNLSRHSDTTEAGISGNLVMQLRDDLQLKADASLTLSGAIGEKQLNALLSYHHRLFAVSGTVVFAQAFPDNYQRSYLGNVLDYSWQNKQLITTTAVRATFISRWKILPVQARFSWTNVGNNPFFIQDSWRQDTLTSLSVLSLRVRADLKWKKLFFQPEIRLQQATLDWIPAIQAMIRAGFDGYLFRSKKLRATVGVEAGYTGSYQLLGYVPVMDTYIPTDGTAQVARFREMPKLHFFTQYELGFFRWFIRVENIEQAFLKNVNMEAIGYPVVPLQLRIGMSWDLFN